MYKWTSWLIDWLIDWLLVGWVLLLRLGADAGLSGQLSDFKSRVNLHSFADLDTGTVAVFVSGFGRSMPLYFPLPLEHDSSCNPARSGLGARSLHASAVNTASLSSIHQTGLNARTLWPLSRTYLKIVFTALYGIQTRSSVAMRILSVRPSVCLSLCRTRDLWQNERIRLCVQIFTPYEKSLTFSSVTGGGRCPGWHPPGAWHPTKIYFCCCWI